MSFYRDIGSEDYKYKPISGLLLSPLIISLTCQENASGQEITPSDPPSIGFVPQLQSSGHILSNRKRFNIM